MSYTFIVFGAFVLSIVIIMNYVQKNPEGYEDSFLLTYLTDTLLLPPLPMTFSKVNIPKKVYCNQF